MVMTIRPGLGLLVALLLMVAGSGQVLAQETPEQDSVDRGPATENRSDFEQSDVAIGDDNFGIWARIWSYVVYWTPYALLVIVVGILIVVYVKKNSSASPGGPSHASSEPAAEESATQLEPSAPPTSDAGSFGEVESGLSPTGDGSDEGDGGDGGGNDAGYGGDDVG